MRGKGDEEWYRIGLIGGKGRKKGKVFDDFRSRKKKGGG